MSYWNQCDELNPAKRSAAKFVEQGWKLVQPLLDAWARNAVDDIPKYAAGSEGPKEADALLARSGHAWRSLGRDVIHK